ncbi:MAG TPA: hypothetical protein VMW04_03965 [Patescibacteria group bacterium]|nr:hypothetical protein [Patescibacteria group bacterium]
MNQIFVYSGEDIVSSRKAFLEHLERLKGNDFEVVRLNGKDVSEESLELLSAPTSLFGQKRVLVIEGLLSRQKSKEKDKIIQIVSLLDCSIVFWEGKDFSKAEQAKYSGFAFKNFKLPAMMFRFLETITPGGGSSALAFFRQTIPTVDINFLFLMLVRQIRLLILAKEKKDILKLPAWQKAKLQKQAALFTQEGLLSVYKRLLQIDFQQKTSASPFDLGHQLELLLTEI